VSGIERKTAPIDVGCEIDTCTRAELSPLLSVKQGVPSALVVNPALATVAGDCETNETHTSDDVTDPPLLDTTIDCTSCAQVFPEQFVVGEHCDWGSVAP
jgi:hypothetical protein